MHCGPLPAPAVCCDAIIFATAEQGISSQSLNRPEVALKMPPKYPGLHLHFAIGHVPGWPGNATPVPVQTGSHTVVLPAVTPPLPAAASRRRYDPPPDPPTGTPCRDPSYDPCEPSYDPYEPSRECDSETDAELLAPSSRTPKRNGADVSHPSGQDALFVFSCIQ